MTALWWLLGYAGAIAALESLCRYGLRRWGDRQLISFRWCPGHRAWAEKQRRIAVSLRVQHIAEMERELGIGDDR
jgi:hypothetical protein